MSLHFWIDIAFCSVALSVLWIGFVPCEGEGGGRLVLKPIPSPWYWFETGEEGRWERDHPARRRPWYLRGCYVTLLEDGSCTGAHWPAVIHLCLLLFWLAFAVWAIAHGVSWLCKS